MILILQTKTNKSEQRAVYFKNTREDENENICIDESSKFLLSNILA